MEINGQLYTPNIRPSEFHGCSGMWYQKEVI